MKKHHVGGVQVNTTEESLRLSVPHLEGKDLLFIEWLGEGQSKVEEGQRLVCLSVYPMH